MISEKVLIDNEAGISLETASQLVTLAKKCTSRVALVQGDYRMNCKSLMSLVAFPISPGTEVVVECEGAQEKEELKRVVEFLRTKI